MRTALIALVVAIPFVFWRDWLLYMLILGYGLSLLFGAAANSGSALHRVTRWMLRSLGVLLTLYLWAMVLLSFFALLVGIGMDVAVALILVAGPAVVGTITARSGLTQRTAPPEPAIAKGGTSDSGEASGDRGQQPDLPSERA